MKRLIPLLVLVLLVPFAYALQSYDVDFGIPTQAVFLYEGDEARFSMLGGEHTIIIEDVGKSSVKLDIGPFINNQTEVWPGLVGFDTVTKVDLDKDGEDDLAIALYSIAEDGKVHLVLQDLTQKRDAVTGSASDVPDAGKVNAVDTSQTVLLAVIGVLILGIVVFLIFRSSRDEPQSSDSVAEHTVELPSDVEEALHEETSTTEKKEDGISP